MVEHLSSMCIAIYESDLQDHKSEWTNANELTKHLCLCTLTLFSLLPGMSVSAPHHGHPAKSLTLLGFGSHTYQLLCPYCTVLHGLRPLYPPLNSGNMDSGLCLPPQTLFG